MFARFAVLLTLSLCMSPALAAPQAYRKGKAADRPMAPVVAACPSHFQSVALCDQAAFSKKACKLDFDPSAVSDGTYDPAKTTCPNNDITTGQREAFEAAFSIAPDHVKSRLCQLKSVLIQSGSGGWKSWGYWEAPDERIRGQCGVDTAIGIGENHVVKTQSAADTENGILAALIPGFAGWLDSDAVQPPPRYADETPKLDGSGLLSVILHELGHVLFTDANVDQHEHRRHERNDRCFDDKFVGEYWRNYSMKRWVSFKANAGTFKKTSYATIGRIAADLGSRRLAFAEIRGNTGREFVSHFAMVSPIEDFVETY